MQLDNAKSSQSGDSGMENTTSHSPLEHFNDFHFDYPEPNAAAWSTWYAMKKLNLVQVGKKIIKKMILEMNMRMEKQPNKNLQKQ